MADCDLKNEVKKTLQTWADWAAASGIYVGYPVKSAFVPGKSRGVGISDDEGLFIDSFVSELKNVNEDSHRVVVGYFVNSLDLKDFEKLGIYKYNKARELLESGIMFLSGRLYMRVRFDDGVRELGGL